MATPLRPIVTEADVELRNRQERARLELEAERDTERKIDAAFKAAAQGSLDQARDLAQQAGVPDDEIDALLAQGRQDKTIRGFDRIVESVTDGAAASRDRVFKRFQVAAQKALPSASEAELDDLFSEIPRESLTEVIKGLRGKHYGSYAELQADVDALLEEERADDEVGLEEHGAPVSMSAPASAPSTATRRLTFDEADEETEPAEASSSSVVSMTPAKSVTPGASGKKPPSQTEQLRNVLGARSLRQAAAEIGKLPERLGKDRAETARRRAVVDLAGKKGKALSAAERQAIIDGGEHGTVAHAVFGYGLEDEEPPEAPAPKRRGRPQPHWIPFGSTYEVCSSDMELGKLRFRSAEKQNPVRNKVSKFFTESPPSRGMLRAVRLVAEGHPPSADGLTDEEAEMLRALVQLSNGDRGQKKPPAAARAPPRARAAPRAEPAWDEEDPEVMELPPPKQRAKKGNPKIAPVKERLEVLLGELDAGNESVIPSLKSLSRSGVRSGQISIEMYDAIKEDIAAFEAQR